MNKGFTIIELICCLLLISILAAVALPRFINLQPNAEKKLLEMVCAEMSAQEVLAQANCRISDNCDEYPRPTFEDLRGAVFNGNSITFMGGGTYPVYEWVNADGLYSWKTTSPPEDQEDTVDTNPDTGTCKVKHCGKKKHWDPDACQCVKD
jgi:prepilin-type N-terminal cleavage/methylation domain-containing protein